MSSLSHIQRVRLLYKGILRLHKGLPVMMRDVGDAYVRDEFKRHKQANEVQAVIFMSEWTKYYVTLANQMGRDAKKRPLGEGLTEEKLNEFTEEQIGQLYELYSELKKADKSTGTNLS